MAKQLDIRIDRRSFTVYPTKLERKKVYGWNELRVVTPNGTPCQQAGLNSDEDGLWMERSELIAFDANGNMAQAVSSSFDE